VYSLSSGLFYHVQRILVLVCRTYMIAGGDIVPALQRVACSVGVFLWWCFVISLV